MGLLGVIEAPFKGVYKGGKGIVKGAQNVLHGVGSVVPQPVRSVLPVAGAIGGAYLGGPVGAGLGGFLGSELAGKNLGQSLTMGGISGLGAYGIGELMGPGTAAAEAAGAAGAEGLSAGGAEAAVGGSNMAAAEAAGTAFPGAGAGALDAAVPAVAGPQTAVTGSVLDTLGEGAKGFLSSNLAIPAAVTAGALYLGNKPIPESGALKQSQGLQGPGINALRTAQAGQITPSQQAQIDKWTKDQYESTKQYLVNSGQGVDSSAWQQMKANIDQSALAMKQGFSDQLFQQGLQELGIADSATQNLVKLKLQQQQQTGQALSSFLLAYGMLGGWNRQAT